MGRRRVKLFLDSCIVIYLVERVEPWRTRIEEALFVADWDRLVISDLVQLECLIRPYKMADIPAEGAFRRYFAGCDTAPIQASTFDLAAHLRADHGLKTPDAIHLAAALESGCAELWDE
ncbi:MAG: type II toxin-antitoxin system VapC family toxin [Dehalococcoidia bacterium]